MPTPVETQMGKIVDAVQSAYALDPTTALLLGVLIGLALGVGGMFWLRKKGIVLKKQNDEPK
jgi:hypothetical protein